MAQFNAKARALASYATYVDDSGTHADSRFVVAAGAICKRENWISLEQKWLEVLDRYKVTKFHASDYNLGFGEYKGWDRDKKISFLKELVGIIENENCLFVAYGCDRNDFDIVSREVPQEKHYDAYKFSLELCVSYLIAFLKDNTGFEPMVLNIERSQKHSAILMNYWLDGMSYPEFKEKYKLSDISFPSSADHIPFQVADLAAYEYYKYLDNFGIRRGVRKSMKSIMQRYVSPALAASEDSIRRFLKQRQEVITSIRNGQ